VNTPILDTLRLSVTGQRRRAAARHDLRRITGHPSRWYEGRLTTDGSPASPAHPPAAGQTAAKAALYRSLIWYGLLSFGPLDPDQARRRGRDG
jgi:hypothetical protein